mgnify:CR=1 FL=1
MIGEAEALALASTFFYCNLLFMKQKITFSLFFLSLFGVLQVAAQVPDWSVNTNAYQGTMTIVGVIQIDGFETWGTDDVVGVFAGEECRGVARPIYSSALGRYFVFLSVFGNETPEIMTYRVYEAARDSIFTTTATISYSLNATLGTIGSPYIFEVGQLPFVFILEDKDGDGFFTDTDCDDEDPFINPGGFEIAGDSIDQNCDFFLEAGIPQITYVNNFNEISYDFNTNGFGIRQESGFDNGAMHSNHPYGDLFFNEEKNLYSILNIPIIVDEVSPTIRFQEVVLVEPGVEGVTYPDAAFRDYVIVEARTADQVNWTPLSEAYDARADTIWEQTYNSNIDPFGGTSNAVGDQTMYRERLLDISEHFSAGDTIKIRFRLYNDFLDFGWGWAIDDLEIQKAVPTSTTIAYEANIFQAFPNPLVDQTLSVNTTQFNPAEVLQFSLYDALGKLVFYEKRRSTEIDTNIQLDLPSLPNGLYYLQISDKEKRGSQKIIKSNQ